MPTDEGGGFQSAQLKFGTNASGDFVVVLSDFPPIMRAAVRNMLTTLVTKGLEAMNAQIEEVQKAGAPGMVIPLGPKGAQ